MADSLASSSFANLLRRSKFASYSPHIGQVYTSPLAQSKNGDWGIKASVRSGLRNLAIPEIDSVLGLPVWKSAEKSARFIRQWGGEGIVARIVPQEGIHSWSTSGGAEMDPWGAQAGRITQANQVIDRLYSDKSYDQFVQERFSHLTKHHYLLHDFYLDLLVKSKFVDCSPLADDERPPLTTALQLSSPDQRIDSSELAEEDLLAAYYYLLNDSEVVKSEWNALADVALEGQDLVVAHQQIKTKASILTEWARIGTELQNLRKPYGAWREAAESLAQKAGSATEFARIQAKAVFAAQPQMVAQLRTPEGRQQAEVQWKGEWEMLKGLAEKKGMSVAEWKSGGDSWDFELRNLRALEKAKAEFMESSVSSEASTSSSPPPSSSTSLDQQWEALVDYSFSHQFPISNWRGAVDALAATNIDASQSALDAFLFKKALAVYPDWILTEDLPGQENPEDWQATLAERVQAVKEHGEAIYQSPEVQEEWKLVVEQLEKDGKSLEEYAFENDWRAVVEIEDSALEHGPVAKPISSNFGVDRGSLLKGAPDVESMPDEDFHIYLESVKRLQPAYRRHLSDAFNTMREQRHRQLSGLPSDDSFSPLSGRTHAVYGLAKASGLSPREQAAAFLDEAHQSSPHSKTLHRRKTITSIRHPTGGLQYSLPTKIEVNQVADTTPGLHLGQVYVDSDVPGVPNSRAQLSVVGGVIVGESERGRTARLDKIDLGLGMDGDWRNTNLEPVNRDAGHYEFRIGSASINTPPNVVAPGGQRAPPRLDISTINKGPFFKEQTLAPLRANAIPDFNSPPRHMRKLDSTNPEWPKHRVSALRANERKSLRIGSVEWVAAKPRMGFNGSGMGGGGGGYGGEFSNFRRSVSGARTSGAGGGGGSIGMSRSRSGESTRRLLESLQAKKE
ncbi:hypothetical protein BDY24DRAFT_382489 [Mrakia frigida]|uniref:uncharacterized protein n=1 Tax=Mrakia frigida TaxID=29902 RepID=UPI003FCBFDE4